MSLYRFLGCDDHEKYFTNTQRHRVVSSRNSSPVHVLSEMILSWSEALLVISGVWDSCQDGIWQKEEGWGWCGQAGKWRGVHSSFPTARGQMLFICSSIWCKTCCFSSLTNIVFFFPLRAPFGFRSMNFVLRSWIRGRLFTTTGPAGANGTSINLWTTSGSTLERRLHSTLPGWVIINITSYLDTEY